MKRIVLACLAGLALSAGAGLSRAQVFVVGVENQDYMPLYGVRDGKYVGFARELFDAFAKERGYQFEYRPLPVPRLYAAFFGLQVDFKFPDNALWKQEQRSGKPLEYSAPVIRYIDGVVVPADRKDLSVEAIRTLGTVAGFTPWAWLDRVKDGKVKVTENASFEALVRQVVARRIDGAYANIAVVNYQLDASLGMAGALSFAAQLPHSRDHYYLSTLKHPHVVKEFDAWLKSNASYVDAMKQRHGVEAGLPAR